LTVEGQHKDNGFLVPEEWLNEFKELKNKNNNNNKIKN